jgi:hypothetical protein
MNTTLPDPCIEIRDGQRPISATPPQKAPTTTSDAAPAPLPLMKEATPPAPQDAKPTASKATR